MSGKRRINWIAGIVVILTSLQGVTAFGQLIINEVCTSNAATLKDFDGDSPDWIEILNSGSDSLNLLNYSLSDDSNDLAKWSFPDYMIAPGEFITLFASGKELSEVPLAWNALVTHGDEWKYIIPDSNTSPDWRNVDFDDSNWENGPSGFGYGDDDDATVVPNTISIFLRKRFTLDDTSSISDCVLHIDYDDGFAAYINGQQVARVGVYGKPPVYDAIAASSREATMYNGGMPVRFDIDNSKEFLKEGENVIAIQVHNFSATSSDLSAIPFLSILTQGNPKALPDNILQLPASHFHTNFKLDADGETLYFTHPDLTTVDSLHLPAMRTDHSFGRKESEPGSWAIFVSPTPSESNNTQGFDEYVEDTPAFSPPGGPVSYPFYLTLTAPNPDDNIYYTLDGSEPNAGSSIFQERYEVTSAVTVRARILKAGMIPGEVVTHSYFSSSDHKLSVLTISTHPDNLWDYYTGIYTSGPDAQPDFPYFGSNFWNDWERPAHIELYEKDGSRAFELDGGIKIFGGWSRGHPQKSMTIFARSEYGDRNIDYQLFKDKPIAKFEAFVLRNSGNDWFGQSNQSTTMFRDVLMTRLTKGMDVECQASRQAIVYINGEYWGIHNIREKINEHFLESNQGVDPDQLDLLEGNQFAIHGDNSHFAEMTSFLASNDISREENYEYIKTLMDVQNFINYQAAQIYYDNTDWPGNNIKYWRPRTPQGKWRWIMYDTDFGFGLWNVYNLYNNTLDFATDPSGPGWPNPPWSTYLLRVLLENQEFKERFINSFADRINTNFHADTVTDLVDELRDAIDDEMLNHVNRWGGSHSNWTNMANELKEFGQLRPDAMQDHIRDTYGLVSKQNLVLDVSDPAHGYIGLNSIMVQDFPWEGIYFQGVPVELTAIPKPGYRFTGWSGGMSSSDSRIKVDLSRETTMVALFEPDNGENENTIIINEICYIQDPGSDSEDWVELYNISDQYVDVSGWTLKDSDDMHSYKIKPGTLMKPGEYRVICRNLASFQTVYPEVFNHEGEMNFGLSSSGDMVRLFNLEMDLVDSLSYGVAAPWPEIPNGGGLTLALHDPKLDNSLATSWELSGPFMGTPGSFNSPTSDMDQLNAMEQRDILFQNSPNPFSHNTRIVFYSSGIQPVRVSVYDMNGRLVSVLADQTIEPGYHEFEWIPQQTDEGIFILRMETPGKIFTQKMIRHR